MVGIHFVNDSYADAQTDAVSAAVLDNVHPA
jgi:hypothetical protein